MDAFADICRVAAWRRRLDAAGFRVVERTAPDDAPAPPALRHAPGSYANLVAAPTEPPEAS